MVGAFLPARSDRVMKQFNLGQIFANDFFFVKISGGSYPASFSKSHILGGPFWARTQFKVVFFNDIHLGQTTGLVY